MTLLSKSLVDEGPAAPLAVGSERDSPDDDEEMRIERFVRQICHCALTDLKTLMRKRKSCDKKKESSSGYAKDSFLHLGKKRLWKY